jgi:dihydroxyacetone kinase
MSRKLIAAAKLRTAACLAGAVSAVHRRLGANEFELGLGIHGEPGALRAKLRHVMLRLAPFWLMVHG